MTDGHVGSRWDPEWEKNNSEKQMKSEASLEFSQEQRTNGSFSRPTTCEMLTLGRPGKGELYLVMHPIHLLCVSEFILEFKVHLLKIENISSWKESYTHLRESHCASVNSILIVWSLLKSSYLSSFNNPWKAVYLLKLSFLCSYVRQCDSKKKTHISLYNCVHWGKAF